jgi:hypothetical protein
MRRASSLEMDEALDDGVSPVRYVPCLASIDLLGMGGSVHRLID